MFSIVLHKATRVPALAGQNLPLAEAIAKAGALYDVAKMFSAHGSLHSGTCVLVLSDENALALTATGHWPNSPQKDTLYQCGSW